MHGVPKDVQPTEEVSDDLYIGLRLQAGRPEHEQKSQPEVQAYGGVRLKCSECGRGPFEQKHPAQTTCSHDCSMAKGRRKNNARRKR